MMNTKRKMAELAIFLLLAALAMMPVHSQETSQTASITDTQAVAERDLERGLRELSELREKIAGEKLPLTRRLSELENRLIELRAEYDAQSRSLDNKNLELTNLAGEIKGRGDERGYISNLFDEYIRNIETRVHIVELQRYQEQLEAARLAPENDELDSAQVYTIQTEMIGTSLDRLFENVGGTRFEGRATGDGGRIHDVTFALLGPVALYGTADGSDAGIAEQRLGSLMPSMTRLGEPQLTDAAREIVQAGYGWLPLDPTQGNAQKIEETRESLRGHIAKGGPVMFPILLMAVAALVVSLIKWGQLVRVRQPAHKLVQRLFDSVKAGRFAEAKKRAELILGPTGEMLRAGLEYVDDSKQLVEEVMFEKTLETRLRLQRFLSFIAVCAAAAPLMGLLGTVTGIINTFKLITVFGTGDAKTLSSGISEALITTEFGLIVAIPALFLHAFLSRKARRVIDAMEKTAVSFLNRIPTGSGQPAGDAEDKTAAGEAGPDEAVVPAAAKSGSWTPELSPAQLDH